jgi:1-deoxy-D-xylulose-5-phosphate reductoisomerase
VVRGAVKPSRQARASKRRVAILGSTGSIGLSALSVARHLKGRVEIGALAAGKNGRLLLSQAKEFRPALISIGDASQASWLKSQLAKWKGKKPRLLVGPEGLRQLAAAKGTNLVLTSVVGSAGLLPTLAAIHAGKDIALANKETLVAGGELVQEEVRSHGVSILPVDSEHNAIFQCLAGIGGSHELKRLILTASGGPFRGASAAALKKVGVKQALNHPTWKMGAKVTIDSATLMNKGLEVIEAHWLFGIGFDRISVLVHPQSVIHSMVEAVDGSVLAQLGPTDMRLPIQHAFTYPDRVPVEVKHLDFLKLKSLTFEAPDMGRFPCLALAFKAGRMGGAAPAVLNAANEVAVEAFLAGKLDFLGIPRVLGKVLSGFRAQPKRRLSLERILESDAWARRQAGELIHV